MNYIGTSLKTSKKRLKFIIFFLIFSLIISFIIYNKFNSRELLNEIKNLNLYLKNPLNFIFIHIIYISILIMSSFTITCIILFPLYFLYESISLFFNIFIFFRLYKLKGLIFSICYITFTKLIYLILIFILIKTLFNLIKALSNKNSDEFKYSLTKNIKKAYLIIFLIIINDIFIYLFSNNILLKLIFIIN